MSVVIATYNGAKVLGEQLDALSAQRLDDRFEVVIADNGSSDQTIAVAQSYRDRLDMQIVDASAVRGCPAARNAGAGAANGPRLLFLDQDDIVDQSYVSEMSNALEQHGFVAARVDTRTLNPSWRIEMSASDSIDAPRKTHDGVPWALGSALGVTRQAFDSVGGFDPKFRFSGEDIDFCRRMHAAGHELHFVRSAVVHRRLRTTLWSIFRQSRRYGLGEPSRPEHARPSIVRGLLGGTRRVLFARDRSQRALGWFALGRIEGRIEQRFRRMLRRRRAPAE